MKFSRLRITGFKTFLESTDIVIEPGLTGVIGPNGCGKSNLVEALRWVMGETSYKAMRASGMEDVIFSGSTGRPARNSAEVSIQLDNSERLAPAGFNTDDTLEISRRIERDQGSLYRINGREVRARDVQILFADASTGAHSPSMVHQGRIGEIIAAKPSQRRALLEEAAGIAGLHSRRHDAELRLRAAETNLERLEDVLGELEAQLEHLKRQARQAVRFRALSAEIRKAEATLMLIRWRAAGETAASAEKDMTEASARVAEAASLQAEAAKEQALAASTLPDARQRAAEAGAAFARLLRARDGLDLEEKALTARLTELAARLRQIGEDVAREQQLSHENADIIARLDTEETTLKAEGEASLETREARDTALQDANAALNEAEQLFAATTADAAQARARREALARDITTAEMLAGRHDQEAQRLGRERTALDLELGKIAGIDAMRDAAREAEAAMQQAESEVEAADAAQRQASEAETRARAPVREAERALHALETEIATLVKLLGSGNADGKAGVLDALTVAPGYERALAAALGEGLEASEDGAASVFWGHVPVQDSDPDLPDGAAPMATHVTAPEVLARALRQIGIVADGADGAALQKLLAPGQVLVSREGALWRWDGYTASAEAPSAAARRLAEKNRLKDLESRVPELTAALGAARAISEDAKAATLAARKALEGRTEAARGARRQFDAARNILAETERTEARLSARKLALEEAEARLEATRAEGRSALQKARDALETAPDPAALDERLTRERADVMEARARQSEARAARDALVREEAERRRRLEALALERATWRARLGNARGQIEALEARRNEAENEKASLERKPDAIATERRRLNREIEGLSDARDQANDMLARAETRQRETDRAAAVALEALAETREWRGRCEERVSAARARITDLGHQCQEAFDVGPSSLAELAGLAPTATLPDLEGMERRLERYRAERERLGGVNLRADEEARELAERRDSLIRERDDLVEAIHRLRGAIGNLNREGRERLVAAFDVVNARFQELFATLFGGGTAELQFVDSDDPLEAGLEILARPPGKKPQTITLLSGGEQALTSLALIFAVFLTNPAPICVLDEVDAPLDDANIERFCTLLDDMAQRTETRFMVITHNPITMSRMNRLYGVTMVEKGISQVVSVDLATAEGLREAI